MVHWGEVLFSSNYLVGITIEYKCMVQFEGVIIFLTYSEWELQSDAIALFNILECFF